ncbi:MAG: DinB family protein [Chloroflexi bacterium]|nr:DinB family protein [Chloroflexota bacterium]
MSNKLVLLMYESWSQVDRALDGLALEEATTHRHGGSGIAWTLGHVTQMVDSFINVRFQRLQPHPFISNPNFRAGGNGDEKDWQKVLASVEEVRESARRFLNSDQGMDLDRRVPYDGSIGFLRPVGLSLGYAVMRLAAHHFMHAGEILTIRSLLGHTLHEAPEWGEAFL